MRIGIGNPCRDLLVAVFCALIGAGLPAQEPGGDANGGKPAAEDKVPAPEGAGETPAKPPVLKVGPEARAQLRAAKAVVATAKGTKGAERQEILRAALAAYGEVLQAFPEDPAGRAQAHYASGELLRRLGSLHDAVGHYEQAATIDPARYGSRGWYGVGQMRRRLKEYPAAIAAYRKCAAAEPALKRAANSRVWIGRCHLAAGEADQGIQALQAALEAASKPRDVIHAANWLAKALIRKGDLDGAAAALAVADRAVADAVGSERDMARLQRALEKMSARRALQRARDAAGDPVGDAEELEEQPDPVPPPAGGR